MESVPSFLLFNYKSQTNNWDKIYIYMKQRIVLVFTLLFLSMSMFSQNVRKTYESNWKKVEEHSKNSLPKSAIGEVNNILDAAIKDKNVPQIMKAYIYLEKLENSIDRDNDYDFIGKLEELLTTTTSAEDLALLHSVLADMYNANYEHDRWNIDRRTNLSDVVPEDMKEWSANIYVNKIYDHLEAAIKGDDALKNSTTGAYNDIIDLGEDSKIYYPTLYDFVMKRTLDRAKTLRTIGREEFDTASLGASVEQLVLPAKEFVKLDLQLSKKYIVLKYYQVYLKDLQNRGLTNTIVLTELDKFNLLSGLSNSFDRDKKIEALIDLEEEYRDNETTVEIINAIVNELQNSYSYRIRPISGVYEKDDDANQKVYNWLKKGIERYPNYWRIGILKNRLATLESPTLVFEGKKMFYAEEEINYNVLHKNNQQLKQAKTVQLYRNEGTKRILIKNFPLNFSSKTTYDADSAKLDLGKLPLGQYILKDLKPSHRTSEYVFAVSNLISYSRNSAKGEYEIFVVNRKNGKPAVGAIVTLYEVDHNERKTDAKVLATLTTNDLGLVTYKDKRSEDKGYRYYVAAYTVALDEDKGLEDGFLYSGSYNYARSYEPNTEELNRASVSIFADRSIYRPGQVVHMKAIAIDKSSKVLANKKMRVSLYNPNAELVSEKDLTTNEFGSIGAEFVLPKSGLTGNYYLMIDGRDALYFSVEEYKRPTFEIKFDKIDKTFGFGDKITLKGNAKTFSGISLQEANVDYRISRRPFSFWFWNMSNESHYAEGVAKTKDDGSFEIEFTPEAGDGRNIFGRNIYTFNVEAKITDQNGETQSANYTISVGEQSMILNVEMPSKIEKLQENLKINIGAKNLDGADIETSGTYAIYTLDTNDSIQTKLLDGTFKTGEQKELAIKLRGLSSGKLRIEVNGKDDNGKDVKSHADFVLYSFSDKKPPYETDLWLAEKETIFKGNKPVEVIYGTSNKDVYILYNLYNNTKTFERRFIKMSDENKVFKIPYQAEYGDEVQMSFTSIKDGELFTQNVLLKKEKEEKDTELKIKLEVFRDKLRPGQEETWTMSVKDKDNKSVSAEVLASMYDMSLDKINPFAAWMLSRPYIHTEYISPLLFNITRALRGNYSLSLEDGSKRIDVENFKFDRFFYEGSYNFLHHQVMIRGVARQAMYASSAAKPEAMYDQVLSKNMTDAVVVVEESKMESVMDMAEAAPQAGGNQGEESPQIRSNFNETAFFFPQLRTNVEGETVVSFTVPESNTTWRFRAFAHDKDSRVGELEQTIVTRKELMVTPNMPRFVRQGDRTSISTKISNLSDKAISGNVRIEFFNPIDDKLIELSIKEVKQTFELAKDASTSATWLFDVPADMDMLGVRIVADSELFSDGEQHVLAILSNRMLVTETLPVDVVEKGEQTYVLNKLAENKSNTLDTYKLTFEFASNPVWYAVQALPTLSNPSNENAVNWFATYYVNTLGASMMQQYPKIANVIKAWTKQGGDKETLVSKLSKNEELKTILQEETPWVLDAKSETEQMERLALLFDLNNTRQSTTQAIAKLADLQTTEGGWSWYKGMYPNRSITQYILYGLANLQHVGSVQHGEQVKMMQMNALKYVDERIVSDFNDLKKYNKDWQKAKTISTSQLEYLYIRAMYRDIPISQEARAAERFYTDVVSRNWTSLGLYEKSLLAVLLPQLGQKALAAKVAASIKEHSVSKKEMGTYWPNNTARVFLSQSAVSIHVFLMEALKANGATTEEMDNMKRWLVKQKQAQIWGTTHATIDAIGALMTEGSNWFESDAVPTIKVGQNVVKPESKELGTGYFKTSWSKAEITADMATVTIHSEDSKPAYGALYWQYYEDLDKITKQDGSLNINKELYKEVVDQSGKSLMKITEQNPLQVGDKVIVRLVVRSDRDLEFVQLKDMRASCFEPVNTKSGMAWQNGAPYYQTTKDGSTNFFFDVLPKGTYVFEYPIYVNRVGEYSNGITSIQSAYAPEFISHTAGIKVIVK